MKRLMLTFLAFLAMSAPAHATLTCTAEGEYTASQIKLCTFRVSPSDVRRGTVRERERAALNDSVEIQVFRDRPGADPAELHYIRVLIHKEGCNTMLQNAYHDTVNREIIPAQDGRAPVCYIGWMNRAEYDTTRTYLTTNYNTLINALLTGMGTGGYAFVPSISSVTILGPLFYVGFRLARLAMNSQRIRSSSALASLASSVRDRWSRRTWFRFGSRPVTPPTVPPVAGGTVDTVGALLSEAQIEGAARVGENAAEGAARTGEVAVGGARRAARAGLEAGTLVFIGLVAYQMFIRPLLDSARHMVAYDWLGDSHMFTQYLHAENNGLQTCLRSRSPRGNLTECLNGMSASVRAASEDLHSYEHDTNSDGVLDQADRIGTAAVEATPDDAESTEEGTGTSASASSSGSSTRVVDINPPAGQPLVVSPLTVSWGLENVRNAWIAFFRPACTDWNDESTCYTSLTAEHAGFYRRAIDISGPVGPGSLRGRFGTAR